MGLPEWAKAPSDEWRHRGNYSDTDVVWYHEATNEVIYQVGPEQYVTPGDPLPAPTVRQLSKPRRLQRTKIVAVSAAVATVTSSVVQHFWRW